MKGQIRFYKSTPHAHDFVVFFFANRQARNKVADPKQTDVADDYACAACMEEGPSVVRYGQSTTSVRSKICNCNTVVTLFGTV
jgi:hypothetical protein